MSLGETIYKLRTEKNLSQGDLAERLEVSRQSVSKWENDSAVPDLAKIVKLSEVFDVSIDELVKGEIVARELRASVERPVMEPESYNGRIGFPGRKIAGTVLLCMAFLVWLILLVKGSNLSVVLALPFLVCGILCLAMKKYIGLGCAWALYLLLDIYLALATGVSRVSIFHMVRWTMGIL